MEGVMKLELDVDGETLAQDFFDQLVMGSMRDIIELMDGYDVGDKHIDPSDLAYNQQVRDACKVILAYMGLPTAYEED
jgi:hypothetical protein